MASGKRKPNENLQEYRARLVQQDRRDRFVAGGVPVDYYAEKSATPMKMVAKEDTRTERRKREREQAGTKARPGR